MTSGANDMINMGRKVVAKKGKGGSQMNVFQPSIQGFSASKKSSGVAPGVRPKGSNLNVVNNTPGKQMPELLVVPQKL